MADVFISYAKARAAEAKALAGELTDLGYDVWWDSSLLPVDSIDAEIDRQLDAAKAVIVIWSPESIRSRWVYAEAEHADRPEHQKLVNTRTADLTDPTRQIPKPFGRIHAADLDNIRALVGALDRLNVPRSGGKPLPVSGELKTARAGGNGAFPWLVAVTLAALLLGGGVLSYRMIARNPGDTKGEFDQGKAKWAQQKEIDRASKAAAAKKNADEQAAKAKGAAEEGERHRLAKGEQDQKQAEEQKKPEEAVRVDAAELERQARLDEALLEQVRAGNLNGIPALYLVPSAVAPESANLLKQKLGFVSVQNGRDARIVLALEAQPEEKNLIDGGVEIRLLLTLTCTLATSKKSCWNQPMTGSGSYFARDTYSPTSGGSPTERARRGAIQKAIRSLLHSFELLTNVYIRHRN
jgi:hypothetical protein